MIKKELEKEADERCSKYFRENCYNKNKWADTNDLKNMWQNGVEFGYNKANEWHKYSERPKEKINALCFDTGQNKFILGFYDLEADEWLRYGGYETIHIDLWKKIEVPKVG